MLTRDVYNSLLTEHKKRAAAKSFSLVDESGTFTTRTNLACYFSYVAEATRVPNLKYTVITMPKACTTKDLQTVHLLMFNEGPLSSLMDIIYEHSYKEWMDFEDFQIAIFKEGLVLEHSLINEWCAASVMAVMMIHRLTPDILFSYPEKKVEPPKTLNEFLTKDAYSKSAYWFPGSANAYVINQFGPIGSYFPEMLEQLRLLPMKPGKLEKALPIYPDAKGEKLLSGKLLKNENWRSGAGLVYQVMGLKAPVNTFNVAAKLIKFENKVRKAVNAIYAADSRRTRYMTTAELRKGVEQYKPELLELIEEYKKEMAA